MKRILKRLIVIGIGILVFIIMANTNYPEDVTIFRSNVYGVGVENYSLPALQRVNKYILMIAIIGAAFPFNKSNLPNRVVVGAIMLLISVSINSTLCDKGMFKVNWFMGFYSIIALIGVDLCYSGRNK